MDDDKFKKLRAVLGFRSLPEDRETYSLPVLKAAARAQELLVTLQSLNRLEKPSSSNVRVTSFYKTDNHVNCFQYLVKTNPLFDPARDPSDTMAAGDLIDLTADDCTLNEHFTMYASTNCLIP